VGHQEEVGTCALGDDVFHERGQVDDVVVERLHMTEFTVFGEPFRIALAAVIECVHRHARLVEVEERLGVLVMRLCSAGQQD
jgi:hypothetical protein